MQSKRNTLITSETRVFLLLSLSAHFIVISTHCDNHVYVHLCSFSCNFLLKFRFIAEESDTAKNVITDDPTWIIDPIDGTNNYVQRIPFVAISVAFVCNKEICFGITFNPILNEFYEARVGNGAFLNGKPIRCSNIEQLKDATIGHEVSLIRVEKYRERNLKQVTAFASASHG